MANEKFIFTSDIIEKIQRKSDDGYKITRQEKFWFDNLPLVKRKGLVFSYSNDELLEYAKCKCGIDIDDNPFIDPETQILKQSGVQYFAEKYCMMKNEDGRVKNIRLRDYQNNILDLYTKNRFSILMGSRQIGKCVTGDTLVSVDGTDMFIYELWYNTISDKKITDIIKYYLYKILFLLR